MIIDTHCHIYGSEMENAEQIIKEAAENDICVILNGTDPLSNREILELVGKYENVYGALGYFHTFADEVTEEDISLLDSQLENDKIVAVGEIGLDYYHTRDNKDKQKQLFEKMLTLAQKHGLPAIVHSRKSMQDTYDILKTYNVSGSIFYMGIGGPVTNTNNKKTRKMLREIDMGHMLVETDSPYLTPQEKRGETNTPLNIKYVIRKIAEELDMEENEVVEITTKNAKDLFKF